MDWLQKTETYPKIEQNVSEYAEHYEMEQLHQNTQTAAIE